MKTLKTLQDLKDQYNINDIEEQLNFLYQELDAATRDLYLTSKHILDSGEENWVRDQERLIQSLDAKIEILVNQLKQLKTENHD